MVATNEATTCFQVEPKNHKNLKLSWKAAEFRAWLLYFSMPALKDFLPQNYLNHWSLGLCNAHLAQYISA